jgi:ABC-2 type transport system ATP-binding protein
MAQQQAAPPPVIATSGLAKSYKVGFFNPRRRRALDGLTLEVRRGEIFGYLGPNGSGKSTTLKILMGLVFPDEGTASVFGAPLEDTSWRGKVGYLPEHPYFYDYLTPAEYLEYAGRLFGLSDATRRDRACRLIELVGITRARDLPLRRFSKGMIQRVGIAQALINDPEVVFLDEPMSGLDPIGRRMVRDIILGLRKEGKTVFFSTHILSDAETLCDRVALLHEGRLIKVGRLDEILNQDVSHVEVLLSGGTEIEALPAGVLSRQAIGERWRLEVDEGALARVLTAVTAGGARILSVQPIRQSLEDYFVRELGEGEGAVRWDLQD